VDLGEGLEDQTRPKAEICHCWMHRLVEAIFSCNKIEIEDFFGEESEGRVGHRRAGHLNERFEGTDDEERSTQCRGSNEGREVAQICQHARLNLEEVREMEDRGATGRGGDYSARLCGEGAEEVFF
jgi:hypothetical protein